MFMLDSNCKTEYYTFFGQKKIREQNRINVRFVVLL